MWFGSRDVAQDMGGNRHPWKWALAVVGCVTLVRLLWHAFGPIGVTGDEAYYWDWSRRPSFGYYSKPPGIAWAQWLGGFISGQAVFGMKAVAVFSVSAGLLMFYKAMQVLGGEKVARPALVMMALVPGNLLLASFLTTDSLLVFFWNTGMWMAAILLKEEQPPKRVYLVLFLCLGLGSLCKQMMLVQILLLWISFAILRREVLRRPAFIAATVCSVVFLLPTLLWNISNDWITLEHTRHHFETSSYSIPAIAGRVGEFYAVTAGLISPVLFVLLLGAVWLGGRNFRKSSEGEKFLWLWGGLPFVLMTLMALRQQMNPNWPAVYYTALTGLAAYVWTSRGKATAWQAAGWVALAFSLLVFVAPLALDRLIDSGKVELPKRGWTGYDDLAERIDKWKREGDLVVVSGHRFTASQLAFHMEGQPNVYLWNSKGRVRSQYDLWPAPPLGKPVLLVAEGKAGEGLDPEVAAAFGNLEDVSAFVLHPRLPSPVFRVYRSTGLESWRGLEK